MIITIDNSQIARLKKAIVDTGRDLRKEIRIAVNSTAKKSKSIISKQIRKELATSAKAVNKTITISKKAEFLDLSATVEVKKTKRIPLREFGARQKKKGVSYRVSKTKGRKTILGAFQGPKPGMIKASWRGRVFKRVGKARLPIVQLYGPSSWGVFVVGDKIGPSAKAAEAELKKQIDRRIRFINLKKSGAI